MTAQIPTTHASAVLVGARAILIRGPSGSGKSHLAITILQAAGSAFRFARLVGDDRVYVIPSHGRLLVRPAPVLAGLLEIRGIGLQRLPFEPVAVVGLVVDLAAAANRLPDAADLEISVAGIMLPRLAVAAGQDAFGLVLNRLKDPKLAFCPAPADLRARSGT